VAHISNQIAQATHRFYASVAAGFPFIPTVLGWVPEAEI
jgi:hypothetical protein